MSDSRSPAIRPTIAVVDYRLGNRRSVEKALVRVGARATLTADRHALAAADGIVLPGVGAFPAAMEVIEELDLHRLIPALAAEGKPIFGSCLGMQLLLDGSEEHGGAAGLGLIAGTVGRLNAGELKLPHIGWSEVARERETPLWSGLPERIFLYHVHSYVAHPAEERHVLATAEYGERFAALIGDGNVFGAQSHPEKSSKHGLALLANFVALCARRSARLAGASA
ncbi:MAG: imidazole glycerol phosphate synthase subunit HisH [Solirubrobacteraceae bacterium]